MVHTDAAYWQPSLPVRQKFRGGSVSRRVASDTASVTRVHRKADEVPARRVDARTERWRAHRVQVRIEFVEAAFRALDAHGPDVSMGDIAKEAGAAKPKLYRHFEDKTDLYNAIVDRVREMLWERLLGGIDLTHDSAAELVRRAAAEYVAVVSEHPNVFRFILHSHFSQQARETERALAAARQSARRAAEFIAGLLPDESVDVAGIELVSYSIFGAVASATDWWLGANQREVSAMPVERFIDYLAESISALAQAHARFNGVRIEPDEPLRDAFVTD
ncbi:TetR family transcriptional regulator [Nocardia ignorata]|uniref:TetR family transcriptional regulator n=1 Tax=Nocardia ignorata TaxID=145285 RepID=A0A4R6PX68_NOCIG|nr:TetR family transcriptional regulator [Nocardia ignorata]